MARDAIQRASDYPAYDPAYGGIPNYSLANPSATNLGNLGSLYGLTTGLDTATGAGAIAGLNQEIPGVSGSIGASRAGIDTLLSGQVPADVIQQLQQQAAEIGAGRGMGPMAPNTNAGYLKALGLTSLGMKQQGREGLNALMTSVPRAPQFDPTHQLVSPDLAQEVANLQAAMRVAPNPTAAARANVAALQSGLGIGGGGSGYGGGGWSSRPVTSGPAFGDEEAIWQSLLRESGGGSDGGGVFTAYGPGGGPTAGVGLPGIEDLYDTGSYDYEE